MRYPLSTVLAEDSDGIGQPVAFALLAREDEASIKGFLNFISKNNNMERTQTVIVDKDQAEINAVKAEWPHVRIMICYFHIIKALDRKLASSGMSADDKAACGKVSILLTVIA
jgi:transposase-like protein